MGYSVHSRESGNPVFQALGPRFRGDERAHVAMTLPLSGLLVVSLEQAVAAPQATCRLADAGARVIKIERPEGDFARGYDDYVHGESANFVWLNRGKESVVLDLAQGRGQDAVRGACSRRPTCSCRTSSPARSPSSAFRLRELRKTTSAADLLLDLGLWRKRPLYGAQGLRPAGAGGSRARLRHRRAGGAGAGRIFGRRYRRRHECLSGDPRSADRARTHRRRRGDFGVAVRRHGGMDDGAAAARTKAAIRSSASGSRMRRSRLTACSRAATAPTF